MKWQTEKRIINDLIPYEHNPRQMTDKQNKDLTKSLEKFDLVEIPAINTDGVILAGHQRLRIMQALGRGGEEIDVRVPDRKLTEKEVQEYNIRSNKNTGEFDFDVLANAFDTTDLLEWGFDEKDLKLQVDVEEDEVPEPPVEPTTKLGDLFQLGNHRLLCGDATDFGAVDRLMDGKKADMVFTDPPYGIDAEKMTMGTGAKDFHRGSWDSERPDVLFLLELAPKVCIWGGNYFSDVLPVNNDWLCWHKKNDGLSFSEFELAWTNFGKNTRLFSHHWGDEKKQHVTMKPVTVCAWGIQQGGKADIVLDLFGGSGSTLIACEQLNRSCYMMELDGRYCDVIIKRWENLTGQKAEKL